MEVLAPMKWVILWSTCYKRVTSRKALLGLAVVNHIKWISQEATFAQEYL